ncbi:MAG: bifunctional phosphoribosyl-AMP cyclohydrolase/phosphoribosyl-ATP diphosphatase HisIE [Lachnospiraceae bacterium]|jgi:phosphoribosyl-ATP pyrophosphohydrolase/phosphoribosyl-AMP cyclohydrolase|nr:bifunctional phosphoribosyl-AMP cyclohydrolase/phosphoribosyl-ATP diphosphatase HisIE [Lachnospiraceae bacterium]
MGESVIKKFIPCIFLLRGNAVAGLRDDAVVSPDPVALARTYAANDADGLLIFDRSEGDREHEQSIAIIRTICASVPLPVIGAGNIHRMEDVKKLIYAGCDKAALNYSRQGNIDLTKQVSEKFGKNRIAACYRVEDSVKEHMELIRDCVDTMILLDESAIREAVQITDVPTLICIPDVSLDKILELLRYDAICGITGKAVNDNSGQLAEIKKLCAENGIHVRESRTAFSWDDFKKDAQGLLPCVVQEDSTDEVLMVAWMNEEAYRNTVRTGRMTYWSRSRGELWVKGETSGHYQYVRSLTADCDMDTLLARVEQIGAACHTGAHSCFFNRDLEIGVPKTGTRRVLEQVYGVIADRREHPKEGSYTNYLFDKGLDKMLKKLGEENSEIIIASKNTDNNEIIYEMSDYLYHMMVVMAEKGITWEDLSRELLRREQKPEKSEGSSEKAGSAAPAAAGGAAGISGIPGASGTEDGENTASCTTDAVSPSQGDQH